jgi:hypothetical protein
MRPRKPQCAIQAELETFFSSGGTGTAPAIAAQLDLSRASVYQVMGQMAGDGRIVKVGTAAADTAPIPATVWGAAPMRAADIVGRQPALVKLWTVTV